MHHPDTFTPDREEHAPGLYRQMGIYAPFIWITVMVLRLGVRTGVLSPDILAPSSEPAGSDEFPMNRQLRRARASCLRRARRCRIKHGKINPEDYTPRAYAHLAYVVIMDKALSAGQFFERYIRDNGLSRVEVFGMDGAHRITGFCNTASCAGTIFDLAARLRELPGPSALNLAAPADPAPP